MFASSKKLDNLIGFTDYNKLQLDAPVSEVCDIAPLADKWAAFGWNVIDVKNGNDPYEVKDAVEKAKANRGSGKPTMVILNTTKGCGVSFVEAMGANNHHIDLSKEDMQRALDEIKGGAN